MGFFDKMKQGMERSRTEFRERMNLLFKRGPEVDDDFWDELEETLILSDVGASATMRIVGNLRDQATRKALPDSQAVYEMLKEQVADIFIEPEVNPFEDNPSTVLFVGINGAGKTTTVGKIANEQKAKGKKVLLGGADTFRAAAIEQLDVWAQRSGVELISRERGADPASVCYDVIEKAEAQGVDLTLIDTAGRLHTSDDLMRELGKVVKVVRKRCQTPVYTVLVIDATTGQNGLNQAQMFHKALELDGLIITKLDGTAKGGITIAISHELGLPIYKIGVGESIEDLRDFDPMEFASGLIGDEEDA